MIKSVNNYPVSQLFDIDSKLIYSVPRYQREYSWTKNQWEYLFDDILGNNHGYFLGSIICINMSIDALGLQRLELVDGQQRLTTLSLLFAAIYHELKRNEQDLDDDQLFELINLRRKLVLKKGNDVIRVKPQIQNHNLNDYRAVLSGIKVIEDCEAPPYAGNRKIFRAYRYFQDRLKKIGNEESTNQLEKTLHFLDKVNHSCMVKIEVDTHADAYTLFESLNNRGMPLTAIDLIKNKLLARLESIEPRKVDHYFEKWNRLLNYLGDDYSIQERFFRHYYNAFKDELKTLHNVPVATRSNLIQIYEKLIDKDAKVCLEKITGAGRIYALILSRNPDDAPNRLEKPLKDLERIQGAPSYLLMLYLLIRKSELQINDGQLKNIIELLVRFFVRRNLTDIPPTRDLTRLFMSIIDKLTGVKGDEFVEIIREQLSLVSASDDLFCQKLEGPVYDENSGVTRFILCSLAEQAMTKESWIDLWRIENRQYVWTIEHIFPQSESIPRSWVEMIAVGDEQKAKEYQQSHVHKLGNLTISGFNSALGNKSFIEKRDRTDRKGLPVGYKNSLKLNEDLASAEMWTIRQIDDRTAKMVNKTLELFKV